MLNSHTTIVSLLTIAAAAPLPPHRQKHFGTAAAAATAVRFYIYNYVHLLVCVYLLFKETLTHGARWRLVGLLVVVVAACTQHTKNQQQNTRQRRRAKQTERGGGGGVCRRVRTVRETTLRCALFSHSSCPYQDGSVVICALCFRHIFHLNRFFLQSNCTGENWCFFSRIHQQQQRQVVFRKTCRIEK